MTQKLTIPSIERLTTLLDLCDELCASGISHASSSILADKTGWTADSIRKDISCLEEVVKSGAGYTVGALKNAICVRLGLVGPRKACVVGLGRLGSAIIDYRRLAGEHITVVAGFDANSNRLETLRTRVKVYPAYQITDIVKREGIELGIIAVPADAALTTMDALVRGGVKGIVNLAPVILKAPATGIVIRNLDMVNELRVVLALLNMNEMNNQQKE